MFLMIEVCLSTAETLKTHWGKGLEVAHQLVKFFVNSQFIQMKCLCTKGAIEHRSVPLEIMPKSQENTEYILKGHISATIPLTSQTQLPEAVGFHY